MSLRILVIVLLSCQSMGPVLGIRAACMALHGVMHDSLTVIIYNGSSNCP